MPTRLTLSNDLSNLISSANYNAAKIQLGLDSTASPTFSSISVTSGLSGNASTASTLATSRTINGISFNGSANITIPVVPVIQVVGNSNAIISAGITNIRLATALTSACIFTIPSPASYLDGNTLTFNDTTMSLTNTNTAILSASVGTINGASNIVISTPGASPILVSNGTNKWTLDIRGITRGGTGSTTASGARINLGLGPTDNLTFASLSANSFSAVNGNFTTVSNNNALTLVGGSAVSNLILSNVTSNLFQLGGTTSAFPAFKRSGTDVRVRLADDTGETNIIASGGIFQAVTSSGAINVGSSNSLGWTSGTRMTGPDGTLNIYSTAASPFSSIYIGSTNSAAAPAFKFGFSGTTIALRATNDTTDANLTCGNITTNGLHYFGLATSAYPMFKRSGSGVQVRVADDTADASFTAGVITGSSLNSTGGGNIAVANSFGWLNASRMNGGSDGNITMWSTAAGQFAGLNFGSVSNSSASPALRIGMNGTTFALRATNDTIDANLTCGNVTASGNLSAVNGTFSNSVSSKSISATSIILNGSPVAPSPVTYIFQYASNNAGVAVLSGVSTFTPPTGWVTCMAEAIQGGAGGGSGRMGAVGTNRLGGTGGGGGNRTVRTLFSVNVPAGTWTVTVGAGGAGGAGVPALSANTNGNPGSIGGASGLMRGSTTLMSAGASQGGGSINNGNTGVGGTSAVSIGGSITSTAGTSTYAGFAGYGVSASTSGTSTSFNPNGPTGGAGGGSVNTTEGITLSGTGYGGAAHGGAANASGGGFAPAAILTGPLYCGIGGSGAGGGTNGGTDGAAGGDGAPGLVTLIFNF